jgi:ferredoxin
MRVTILNGCIACGVCEALSPEVFTVLETCFAENANVSGREDICREASDACPVSVIQIKE